jgi:hypothetical protein
VIPRSGRPRRGPAVRWLGPQRSGRLTSGRQQGDRHRAGHPTSGHRQDDRHRTNHGRRAGQFARCRRPGVRRMRNAQQAAAAGRHLRPDCQNGAGVLPRASHHRGGHRPGAGRRGNRCPAGHCCAGHPHGDRRRGGHQCGAGRRGGHQCGAGRRGNHPYAAQPPGGRPHEGCQYVDHRSGNCPPAGCRPGHGLERGGRYSRWRSRATLPGQPGRCRCGTNLACSPVSHPAGCPGPAGCHSSCFHPDCPAGHRLGPGPSRCLDPGAADRAYCYPVRWHPTCWHPTWRHPTCWRQVRWHARRWTYWAAGKCCQRRCPGCCCFRRRRSRPRPHRGRLPGRLRRRDPRQHRCRNVPDHGTHPRNGFGPAPRHHYGPGRPDPARLPRSCSTLS